MWNKRAKKGKKNYRKKYVLLPLSFLPTYNMINSRRKEDCMGKPQNFSKREVNGPRFSWFTPPTLRSWIDNSQAQTSYPVFLKVILWRPTCWLQAVNPNFPKVPWWGKVKLKIKKTQKSKKENRKESKAETTDTRALLASSSRNAPTSHVSEINREVDDYGIKSRMRATSS